MIVDTNAFGQALMEYKAKNHEGFNEEMIIADLKKIFEDFEVRFDTWYTTNTSDNPNNSTSTNKDDATMLYIKKVAKGILEKEELEQKLQESIESRRSTNENTEDSDKKDFKQKNNENVARKFQKRPISFNIAEIGDSPLEAARGQMRFRLKKRGYSEEEMDQSVDQLGTLGVDDKSVGLNIQSETLVDQLVEIAKKLYLVYVKNVPVKNVRDMSLTSLEVEAKDNENTTSTYTTEDGSVVKTSTHTKEPNVDVTLGANGNSGTNVENDALTAEDEREIEQYNIEGINTHEEMDEYRKTKAYKEAVEGKEPEEETIFEELSNIITNN